MLSRATECYGQRIEGTRRRFSQAVADGPREPLFTRPLQPLPVVVVSHSHLDPETEAWVASLGKSQLEPADRA